VRPELFTIRRTGSGCLSTMARPRGGDWLEVEMKALRAVGVGVLVSLLTAAEMIELDLVSEPESVPDTDEQREAITGLRVHATRESRS
jgi:hypothetical protein